MKRVSTDWFHHERLARLSPRLVHSGHGRSFDTSTMHRLIGQYLSGRREPGCPGLS